MTNTAPAAWMHPNGRVIDARTMLICRTTGGAQLAAVADYSIPLYDHREQQMGTPPPTPGATEEAPMQEYAVEQQIQFKGLTAARITPGRIDAQIVGEDYHVFPGTTVTVCCLHLRNGFNVTGESACASAENFNAELGRRIAKSNARQKVWALEGYLLRQHLAEQEAAGVAE